MSSLIFDLQVIENVLAMHAAQQSNQPQPTKSARYKDDPALVEATQQMNEIKDMLSKTARAAESIKVSLQFSSPQQVNVTSIAMNNSQKEFLNSYHIAKNIYSVLLIEIEQYNQAKQKQKTIKRSLQLASFSILILIFCSGLIVFMNRPYIGVPPTGNVLMQRQLYRDGEYVFITIVQESGTIVDIPARHGILSPDGSSIVYMIYDSRGDTVSIYLTNSFGTNPQLIDTLVDITSTIPSPIFSPDGEKIAYISESNLVLLFDIASSTFDPLEINASQILDWTRNGNLVYRSGSNAYSTNIASERTTVLSTTVSGEFSAESDIYFNGEEYLVVYSSYDETTNMIDGNLEISDIDGNNIRSLGVQGRNPTWSPDGEQIIYSRYNTSGLLGTNFLSAELSGPSLFIIDSDGENNRLFSNRGLDIRWLLNVFPGAYYSMHIGDLEIIDWSS